MGIPSRPDRDDLSDCNSEQDNVSEEHHWKDPWDTPANEFGCLTCGCRSEFDSFGDRVCWCDSCQLTGCSHDHTHDCLVCEPEPKSTSKEDTEPEAENKGEVATDSKSEPEWSSKEDTEPEVENKAEVATDSTYSEEETGVAHFKGLH